MRADYDSEGDSIQIWLKETDRLERDEVLLDGWAIVSFVRGLPVLVETHSASKSVEEPLRAAADAYELDFEELLAAAEAALAAPDRVVTLTVSERATVA
jgi:hypothetical protein